MSGPNGEGLRVRYGQPVSETPAVPIVDFLRARYDEIEAAADEARMSLADAGVWRKTVGPDGMPSVVMGIKAEVARGLSDQDATHIALNDPAYVLADIAAKRKILALWESPTEVENLPDGGHDGRDPDERERDIAVAGTVDHIVRLLAAPFAAHPDFDPAWTVDP